MLRAFSGDPLVWNSGCAPSPTAGVPNYFGPQRFGRDGGNLRTALAWFSDGVAPADRWQRGFALSAARAAIFNAVLAQRVRDGTWNRLLPGEIVNLDGSGSVFVADAIDAALEERCARLDIHPTGPMWGGPRIRCRRSRCARAEVGARHDASRRSGECRTGAGAPRVAYAVSIVWSGRSTAKSCSCGFACSAGAFATAVLHELIEQCVRSAGARSRRVTVVSRRGRDGDARYFERSSTYTAPLPPSTARAEPNASTSSARCSQ